MKVQSTVTVALKDFPKLTREGKTFSELHEGRMTKGDWKIFNRMSPEDQSAVENVIGQLRTGMANPANEAWLEAKRAEIFNRYR